MLKLLPTTSYVQIAATLYISRNTVKTHLRSIYQKLGGASRSEAIGRAVELRLLLDHPPRGRRQPVFANPLFGTTLHG